ncbi:MAG: PLP-dependent aminotransferase family protein [Lachnospiraceae bacterium]|nr:PLP-dependent aminotransferase family protein [Lachnospiraceae bacterium]
MNYDIKKEKGNPAYLQLYHCFVNDIVKGIYGYGEKLPSKRVVAAETGLSIITVEHAMTLLMEEGYVENRQRSGYYVSFRGGEPLYDIKIRSQESVSVEQQYYDKGEFPFSVLAKTMRKIITDRGDGILVKSSNLGCMELREEISRYLARSRGITVSPSNIVVGSGAEHLYGLIAQLFGRGSVFAIENPSYKKIRNVYEAMGIECDPLPMTQNGVDTKALEKTKAKVLHVTPFNSFPTGVTADISKKLEYLRWADGGNRVIVEDNYDSELTVSRKSEDALFAMNRGKNVIYLNTFSKTLAPSVRVGYMILPDDILKEYNEKLGFYSCTVPIFEQFVLAELLKSGDFERHINRVRRKKRKK